MSVEQIRNPFHFRETASPIARGHFGGSHPPILRAQCSIFGDVLLRGYGQFARHDSAPQQAHTHVF